MSFILQFLLFVLWEAWNGKHILSKFCKWYFIIFLSEKCFFFEFKFCDWQSLIDIRLIKISISTYKVYFIKFKKSCIIYTNFFVISSKYITTACLLRFRRQGNIDLRVDKKVKRNNRFYYRTLKISFWISA